MKKKKPKPKSHLDLLVIYLCRCLLNQVSLGDYKNRARTVLRTSLWEMIREAQPQPSVVRRHERAEKLRLGSLPGDVPRQLGVWQKDLSMSLRVTKYRKRTRRSLSSRSWLSTFCIPCGEVDTPDRSDIAKVPFPEIAKVHSRIHLWLSRGGGESGMLWIFH